MNESHFNTEKWAAMSFYEQMGNIGSEVGRAMNALKRSDESALQGSYFRGLDLIDATVATMSSPSRRRELLRAREEFSKAIELKTVDQGLDDYFMAFAVLARS